MRQELTLARQGLPDFLYFLDGTSLHAEPWGRWTDGPIVTLGFRKPLPRKFELVVDAHAFADNANRPVRIHVGSVRTAIKVSDQPGVRYQISLTNPDGVDTLVLRIPKPVSPSKLRPGQSDDHRALGLALARLKVVAHDGAPAPPDPLHEAKLAEGIDFSLPEVPDILCSLDGVSHCEPWGRWTVGPIATLGFRKPLPRQFDLILDWSRLRGERQ